ncbi:MAG: hypothetical protein L6R37_007998, partial [Teloschistes peruensis]
EVQKLEGHTDEVSAVAFSRDGSLLASASGDQTVRLWNPTTGQEVQKLEGHTDGVRAVAFSQDGSLLASTSFDRTVRLWNPTTGHEVQKLEGHTDVVSAVAFSRDGSLLASASGDQTVRLWNPTTGQEVQVFENIKSITTLDFTKDDTNLRTNRGTLNIKEKPLFVPKSKPSNRTLIQNGWMRRDSHNFLWLPQEYRDGYSTFNDNTFAFGLHSGQVSFLKLDFSFELPHS